MNTKHLQKVFPEIYETFFTKNKIIYSCPFVFSWVGEGMTTTTTTWVSIKQKLPLRMYVGITQVSNPWVHLSTITVYNISQKMFLTNEIEEMITLYPIIQEFLQQAIKNLEVGSWWEISFLSELPDTVWMWFVGAFSTLLAIAIKVIDRTMDSQKLLCEIEEWLDKVINAENTNTYDLIRFAELIQSTIQWEMVLDGTIPTMLSGYMWPIISFHEQLQIKKEQSHLMFPMDYKYFALPLYSFCDRCVLQLPLDFWVLYSGRPVSVAKKQHKNNFSRVVSVAESILQPSLEKIRVKTKPLFCGELIDVPKKSDRHIGESMLGYITFEMLDALRNIGMRGYMDEDVKRVIQTLTKTRHIQNILQTPSSYLVKVLDWLYQQLWFRSERMWFCYNDTNTLWWSLVFSSPLEWIRVDMFQAAIALQRVYPWVEILYASWVDWHEQKWLCCEQDLFVKQTSQFVNENLLILDLLNKGTVFGTYEELIKNADVDVILDTIHMKIYIHWEKLTSKDLHSQWGTIDMLITAMHYGEVDISNKQLPTSSYSKSKNDMVWKIIIPLKRLIKERINKELTIECYGSMYEYYLRVKRNNVRFWVIKKVVI